jgi:ubiquinone/menaquinone biosynthesis C-methylase UbiE
MPDTVDLIYASHVLEYFDREEIKDVIYEWYRVLKPGGRLRLAVPNFAEMAHLYVKQNYPLESFLGPMYGKMKMDGKTIYHKTAYDFTSLAKLVTDTGFCYPAIYDWRDTEHAGIDDHSQAYLPHMDKENGILISLNIETVK